MKIALTSTLGSPLNPRVWSNAPANLAEALTQRGHTVEAIDTSLLTRKDKIILAGRNILAGYPWQSAVRFAGARAMRGAFVARQTRAAGIDHVICCGSLDVPMGEGVPYSIWLDNTWDLVRCQPIVPSVSARADAEIDRLERQALQSATRVLAFSDHVRDNIIEHYGVPADRVHAVGCGSGSIPPFHGEKLYRTGHLLFVAKHQFVEKGGELVLSAFDIIRQARPETKLVLIGSDDVVDRVKDRPGIEAYGYVDREVLNGFFHSASILLQPMLYDSWGQVYLEAMKARAVVVSANIAALPELTDNGRLGVLVDDPTPQALAQAVIATLDHPQADLVEMTREAQERTLDLYNWEAVADRVLSAIA